MLEVEAGDPLSHMRSTKCYGAAMSRTIGQRELRNDNAAVIAAVAAGETFVVTRNGRPVAELRPVQHRRPRFVSRSAIGAAARHGPAIDAGQFRADLDATIKQGL